MSSSQKQFSCFISNKEMVVLFHLLCKYCSQKYFWSLSHSFGQNIVVILTENPLADFPSGFFHISGFDICNETMTNIPRDENKSHMIRAIDYHSSELPN